MILWLIITIALGGVCVGVYQHRKKAPWGAPLAIACFAVMLLSAGGFVYRSLRHVETLGERIIDRELAYTRISSQRLGEYLAQKYPGSKALLVTPAVGRHDPRRHEAIVSGLEQGLGDKLTIVARVDPPPLKLGGPGAATGPAPGPAPGEQEGPTSALPPSPWMSPRAFHELIQPHVANVNVIISLDGLPEDVGALPLWGMESERPKLAVWFGPMRRLRPLIAGGFIVAAVAGNPKAERDAAMPPADAQQAFDKRYLLITPENVDAIAHEHRLFE